MACNGGGSLSPAPRMRPSVEVPPFDVTSRVLESVSTFAEYAERRHELLTGIRDGLEDHVLKMEERARQAVARASAVAEASRAQEAECLAYVERLEDTIRGLQRTKKECAAALNAFQITSEEKRQELDREFDELRRAVEEARRQKLLAQEEQQHYELLRDAAKRRYERAEASLKEFTAKVELRFQEAVASLQASVQQRKRWADEQCARYEERVREASRRAEQNDSSTVVCMPTENAKRNAIVKCATSGTAVAVTKFARDLELDLAAPAASAAAQLQHIVGQQDTGEVQLEDLPMHTSGEGGGSIRALGCSAASSVSEGDGESEMGKGQREALEAVSLSGVTRTSSAAEARVGHALLDRVYAAAASASSAPKAKTPARPHESPTRVATPQPIAAALSPVRPTTSPRNSRQEVSPTSAETPSLVPVPTGRQSASVLRPERKLINDFSCSADAFAALFTSRR
ncbi:hypothetical protein LSCM1_01617 [Leishmania martiniquensis]|uniref:Uncharacterized protein n=1 Tax=Leishmania martiniquensis TaxID=1580590 RepID=A0A836GDK9_9TRYP|nr:hypothetical protein LSCM1_01617 [Leishmania martiniquensis]